MKNLLCKIRIHNYEYSKKEVDGIINNRALTFNIPIRKCKRCSKKQHHAMPRMNGEFFNWKNIR